jgi:hypothetical protein
LTELRVLEAEADQLKKTLTPKVVLARKDVTHIEELVAIGMAQRVELAEAILRRMELETALSKAELDLAVIQNQIQQHRAGK